MRIVFLGPQGVGKGTQGSKLSSLLGVPALSTGDMLRAEVAAGSQLGELVGSLMRAGELVSDEIVLSLINGRVSQADAVSGFILDGFPRTLAQAEGLDAVLIGAGRPLDAVVLFDAPREVLLSRLAGRRTCGSCGAVYHVDSAPSAIEGVCDRCGGSLVQRADDTPESIRRRLDLYEAQTAPLAGYYGEKGLLRRVDAARGLDEVQGLLVSALGLDGGVRGRA
ncbi:MAG: adenylate kinase [Candidatus Sericytochromatia bacterium]|nr:adenylate kinase [Candidatus Sericytochromatia bacterium]